MRRETRKDFEAAVRTAAAYRNSEAGRAWESLIEALVDQKKEDLITAKTDAVQEIQGTIKDLRFLLKRIKTANDE